jgi:diamine N-acetyltransferase
MQTLCGNNIQLRALEPEDLGFLYDVENNESFWNVSNTETPFSRFILTQYITNSHQDIYEAKQLRLVVEEKKSKKNVGFIDLFDFSPQHKRAGIGILIIKNKQQKGFANEALELLITLGA